MTGIFSQKCCTWFSSGWNILASYIFWGMSVCFLPYSKELLRCECHLGPSHCHDCKTELQTLISSCFLLWLNFLSVHRDFKMVNCNCVLALCCQISALEVFSFIPSLEFFSCNSSLSVQLKVFCLWMSSILWDTNMGCPGLPLWGLF